MTTRKRLIVRLPKCAATVRTSCATRGNTDVLPAGLTWPFARPGGSCEPTFSGLDFSMAGREFTLRGWPHFTPRRVMSNCAPSRTKDRKPFEPESHGRFCHHRDAQHLCVDLCRHSVGF